MSIPSKPGTSALKSGLTNIGNVVKTSRFKYSNWNIKPFTQALSKFSTKDYKNFSNFIKALRDQQGLLKELKGLKETAKIVKESKSVLETFFKKVPGGDMESKAAKGGTALGPALILAASIGLTLTSIWAQDQVQSEGIKSDIWTESEIQKSFDRYQKNLIKIRELNRQSDKYNLEIQRTKNRVYALEKQQVPIREKANNALYEVREGRKILEGRIADAKKQANDALYEVRAGREILEQRILEQAQKIADVSKRLITFDPKQFDALKTQFNSNIETIKKNFSNIQESLVAQRNAIDSQRKIITEQQKDVASAKSLSSQALELAKKANTIDLNAIISQAQKAASLEISILKGQVALFGNLINGLATKISGLELTTPVLASGLSNLASGLQKTNETADKALQKANSNIYPDYFSPLQKELDLKFNQLVEQNLRDLKIRDLSQSKLSKEFDEKIKEFNRLNTLSGEERFQEFVRSNNEALKIRDLSQSKLSLEFDRQLAQTKLDLDKQKENISDLKIELDKIRATSPADPRIPKIEAEIDKVKLNIKEQDRLNNTGLDRIDQLALMVAGITPFMNTIPKQTADLINPNIPTPKDIERSVGTGICNSANGGCLSNALNKNADSINNNSNNNTNGLLNKLNTGLQIPELALLGTINDKLGAKLPGGISAFLTNFFEKFTKFTKWVHLDRILNILTWWQTLHNGYMLSSNLGQTMFSVVENLLNIIGIKDADGDEIDVSKFVGGAIDSLAQSLLGVSTWNGIKKEWKKGSCVLNVLIF